MIFVLVVLYNKSLKASETLKGIAASAETLNSTGSALLVWDNSFEKLSENDLQFFEKNITNFEYKNTPQNIPLSKIYNAVIEKIISQQQYKYLVLLDDDSKISPAYFHEILNSIENNKSDVLLPVVKNNDRIISPARFFFCKGNFFKTLECGIIKEKLLAINSGMIISTSFIQKNNFRYNEQLKNYGTDNYFMQFANNHRAIFCILNYSFDHSLNFFDNNDLDKKAEIFSQIKKANKIVFSSKPMQALVTRSYNFLSSVKNAVKYRSLKFFS